MFGNNKLYSTKDFKNNDKLFIKDIFYTIQGEGLFNGHPSTFIRLAYCNLACNFCIEENQRVLLSDFSYKPIKDIEIGDEILGVEKNYFNQLDYPKKQKVLNKLHKGTSEIITLKTTNNELKCTPDHRIFIRINTAYYEIAKFCNKKYTYIFENNTYKTETINAINNFESANVYDITTETGNFICEGFIAHNCDTDFESDAVEMSIDEIVNKVKNITPSHTKLIVLTGGEPFLQPKISELIKKLLDLHFNVQIETAGTVCPSDLPLEHPNFYIVCSPKTGKLNPIIEQRIDAYKYIINSINYSSEDGLPIYSTQIEGKIINLARPISKDIPVYISPMDEYSETINKSNLKTVKDIALKYGYFVSLQTHKILNVP